MHKLYLIVSIFLATSYPLVAQTALPLTSSEAGRSEQASLQAAQSPATNSVEKLWATGKNFLSQHNLHLGMDISYLAQRATPAGKQTAWQGVYSPYASWHVWQGSPWGSGEFNISYILARYWGAESTVLQTRTHAAVALNNYEDNQENFAQLSYTHTLPGTWDFLSATVGQYPIDSFDGTQYMDNQQTALIHNSLSQNASAMYPDSSFGAYVQAQTDQLTAALGYQDGSNLTGAQVRLKDAFNGNYTSFGALIWTPHFPLGDGQYGFLYYYQPSVDKRPGSGHGWSINMQQNITSHYSVFARANGSTGGLCEVKQSYALGGALLDPFSRHPQDALILAVAHNRLSRSGLDNPDFMRAAETVLEAQWVIGIGKLVTIAPDVQFIPRAGLDRGKHAVIVWGLRTTLML